MRYQIAKRKALPDFCGAKQNEDWIVIERTDNHYAVLFIPIHDSGLESCLKLEKAEEIAQKVCKILNNFYER